MSSQRGRVVLTPHAGEMASLTGLHKDAVTADPLSVAVRVSKEFGCTTVLKGSKTTIAEPSGATYSHQAGHRLAMRTRLGFLARELLDEIPRVLNDAAADLPEVRP